MTIRANNISVSRGSRRVLDGVSFELDASDALLIQGPNGIGKTSLLRCIAGLIKPNDGTIDPGLDELVFVSDKNALKLVLTVQENLEFWAQIYQQPISQSIIDQLDLEPLLTREAKTLSAGQSRRVGLARVLISGAKIWALDEPLVSLDTDSVAKVEQLIDAHRRNDGIVILSTHQKIKLPNAKTLDLSKFKPTDDVANDPFLEEVF